MDFTSGMMMEITSRRKFSYQNHLIKRYFYSCLLMDLFHQYFAKKHHENVTAFKINEYYNIIHHTQIILNACMRVDNIPRIPQIFLQICYV